MTVLKNLLPNIIKERTLFKKFDEYFDRISNDDNGVAIRLPALKEAYKKKNFKDDATVGSILKIQKHLKNEENIEKLNSFETLAAKENCKASLAAEENRKASLAAEENRKASKARRKEYDKLIDLKNIASKKGDSSDTLFNSEERQKNDDLTENALFNTLSGKQKLAVLNRKLLQKKFTTPQALEIATLAPTSNQTEKMTTLDVDFNDILVRTIIKNAKPLPVADQSDSDDDEDESFLLLPQINEDKKQGEEKPQQICERLIKQIKFLETLAWQRYRARKAIQNLAESSKDYIADPWKTKKCYEDYLNLHKNYLETFREYIQKDLHNKEIGFHFYKQIYSLEWPGIKNENELLEAIDKDLIEHRRRTDKDYLTFHHEYLVNLKAEYTKCNDQSHIPIAEYTYLYTLESLWDNLHSSEELLTRIKNLIALRAAQKKRKLSLNDDYLKKLQAKIETDIKKNTKNTHIYYIHLFKNRAWQISSAENIDNVINAQFLPKENPKPVTIPTANINDAADSNDVIDGNFGAPNDGLIINVSKDDKAFATADPDLLPFEKIGGHKLLRTSMAYKVALTITRFRLLLVRLNRITDLSDKMAGHQLPHLRKFLPSLFAIASLSYILEIIVEFLVIYHIVRHETNLTYDERLEYAFFKDDRLYRIFNAFFWFNVNLVAMLAGGIVSSTLNTVGFAFDLGNELFLAVQRFNRYSKILNKAAKRLVLLEEKLEIIKQEIAHLNTMQDAIKRREQRGEPLTEDEKEAKIRLDAHELDTLEQDQQKCTRKIDRLQNVIIPGINAKRNEIFKQQAYAIITVTLILAAMIMIYFAPPLGLALAAAVVPLAISLCNITRAIIKKEIDDAKSLGTTSVDYALQTKYDPAAKYAKNKGERKNLIATPHTERPPPNVPLTLFAQSLAIDHSTDHSIAPATGTLDPHPSSPRS